MVPSDTKNQSDQNKTFRDVVGGLWVLGRMFGHEFHALLIFPKFLIADDFAALFGISSHTHPQNESTLSRRGTKRDERKTSRKEGSECTRLVMREPFW